MTSPISYVTITDNMNVIPSMSMIEQPNICDRLGSFWSGSLFGAFVSTKNQAIPTPHITHRIVADAMDISFLLFKWNKDAFSDPQESNLDNCWSDSDIGFAKSLNC